ncbi:unnamed protein product [Cuscuta campestris]|uniref:Uncharacterized protein n=1 Tax=Cuscuta campestris TaxID=132261 RepID=A0A484M8F8_9ASTE|nr:unnamed protein product [Cuscuta campestris]
MNHTERMLLQFWIDLDGYNLKSTFLLRFTQATPEGSSPDIARVVAGGWTRIFAGKPAGASPRIRRCNLRFLSRFKSKGSITVPSFSSEQRKQGRRQFIPPSPPQLQQRSGNGGVGIRRKKLLCCSRSGLYSSSGPTSFQK